MLRGIFRKLNSDNLQLKTTTDISWKYWRFAELRQGESAVDRTLRIHFGELHTGNHLSLWVISVSFLR